VNGVIAASLCVFVCICVYVTTCVLCLVPMMIADIKWTNGIGLLHTRSESLKTKDGRKGRNDKE
jgi:hypothetical protein